MELLVWALELFKPCMCYTWRYKWVLTSRLKLKEKFQFKISPGSHDSLATHCSVLWWFLTHLTTPWGNRPLRTHSGCQQVGLPTQDWLHPSHLHLLPRLWIPTEPGPCLMELVSPEPTRLSVINTQLWFLIRSPLEVAGCKEPPLHDNIRRYSLQGFDKGQNRKSIFFLKA